MPCMQLPIASQCRQVIKPGIETGNETKRPLSVVVDNPFIIFIYYMPSKCIEQCLLVSIDVKGQVTVYSDAHLPQRTCYL